MAGPIKIKNSSTSDNDLVLDYAPVTSRTLVRDDDSAFVSQSYSGDTLTVTRTLDTTRTFTSRSPTLESSAIIQSENKSTLLIIENLSFTNPQANWGYFWGYGQNGGSFDDDWEETAYVGIVFTSATEWQLMVGGGASGSQTWNTFAAQPASSTFPDKIVINFLRESSSGTRHIADLQVKAFDSSNNLISEDDIAIFTTVSPTIGTSILRECFVNNTARVGQEASISYDLKQGLLDFSAL